MDILKVNKTFFYQSNEPSQHLFFYHPICARRFIQPIAIWLFISISLISQTLQAFSPPDFLKLYSFLNLLHTPENKAELPDFHVVQSTTLPQWTEYDVSSLSYSPQAAGNMTLRDLKNHLDGDCLQLPQSSTSSIAYPVLRSRASYSAPANTSQPIPFIQAYPGVFISISLILQKLQAFSPPDFLQLYSVLNLLHTPEKKAGLPDFYVGQGKTLDYDNFKNCLDGDCLQLSQSSTNIIAYPVLRSGASHSAPANTSQPTPFIQAYPREEWENNFGITILQEANPNTDIWGVPFNDHQFSFFDTANHLTGPNGLPYEVVQVLSLRDERYELDPLEVYGVQPGDMIQEYSILFTIRKKNDEPAQDTEQATSAENNSNMAVGYISGSDFLDTSRDANPVFARGSIAPDWESLLNNLDHWEIGYIITSLKASDEFKKELHDELNRDEQSLRKRLIELLKNAK